jgi:hypothetical protein
MASSAWQQPACMCLVSVSTRVDHDHVQQCVSWQNRPGDAACLSGFPAEVCRWWQPFLSMLQAATPGLAAVVALPCTLAKQFNRVSPDALACWCVVPAGLQCQHPLFDRVPRACFACRRKFWCGTLYTGFLNDNPLHVGWQGTCLDASCININT